MSPVSLFCDFPGIYSSFGIYSLSFWFILPLSVELSVSFSVVLLKDQSCCPQGWKKGTATAPVSSGMASEFGNV